jgi:hypothetical protein
MTDIEKLEKILHEEKMKEPLPDTWEGQTTPEWEEETNAILDKHVPYWDKKVNITEYKERYIRPHMELQIIDFQLAQLDNAQHMLIMWAMYPFAILILIVFILNWG